MTPRPRDPLSRFVRAVHRRMIVVRALEGAGAGVAIAAVFALILAVSLLWLGREAMGLSVASLIGGAVIGAGSAMLRLPTMVAAAVEADRQLNLADLLATAWLRQGDDDPWQRAVVAIAEQRCQSLSPSAVVLARFGTRAWSGIGLSAALALTIGALSTLPRQTAATTPGGLPIVADGTRDVPSTQASPTREPGRHQNSVRASADPVDERTSVRGGDAAKTARGVAGAGKGRASARTSSQETPKPDATGPAGASADSATEWGGGGRGGQPTDPSQSSAAGSKTSPDASTDSPPPWAASSWPQARAAAAEQVRRGQIKDEYRDVVREYFDEH